jgi:probable HAF family extracellular repeat protein
VLWDSNGSVHDLGSLGGTSNLEILAVGNAAIAINNRGQVTGISSLPGSQTGHPFLWSSDKGMQDLGLLPDGVIGAGLAINNRGDVVGASISAPGAAMGNPSAVLWPNGGKIADLNDLAPDSPLILLQAFGINDGGEIAGLGVDPETGNVHGFLATPCHGNGDARMPQRTAAPL